MMHSLKICIILALTMKHGQEVITCFSLDSHEILSTMWLADSLITKDIECFLVSGIALYFL
jgi:hypothetical protein